MRAQQILLLPSLAAAASIPARQATTTCTDPAERVEWRTIPDETKAAYLSAVNCLTTKPSRLGLNSTLFEDFPYVHAQLNNDIHFVSSFLPWHRYFLHTYELALRDECGYTGQFPYWDWTQDSGKFPDSPVFDTSATTGFGAPGNGSWIPPTRVDPLLSCVQGGAFANLELTYYQASEQKHCLNRFLSKDGLIGVDPAVAPNWMAAAYSPAKVANITQNTTTFTTFWPALETGPHAAIHSMVGGDMIPSTSPNDPLFFLHHSQVDRVWWMWQQIDPEARNVDYAGNKFAAPDETPAALTDVMTFLGLAPNVTVSAVMTTMSDVMCYKYV